MFCFFSLPRYAITFLALMLFASQGFCQKESPDIDPYLVSFEPAVTIHNGEYLLNCTGVILSPERIAMPSACVASARQLRRSGVVSVKNHQGEYIGQLPAIGDQAFDAIQTLLEPEREVPFVSDLKPDDAFPDFVDVNGLETDELEAGTYYLLSSGSQDEDVVHSAVQLQKLPSVKGVFSLSGVSPAVLEHHLVGSPVVDERRGGIMCLLKDGNTCENAAVKSLAINDGSCSNPYFQCRNLTWSFCESGRGIGQCTDEAKHEQCEVLVEPNMVDKPQLHCRNSEGCGAIKCPYSCDPRAENCNCIAAWGYCELGTKAIAKPATCLDQSGRAGGIDPKCHALKPTTEPTDSPDDFKHSSAFLGVIIGVPSAVTILGVAVVATIVAIACKYRSRSGYESVQ